MRYLTHQAIYRDSSYYVSIILSSKEMHLYEIGMSFDLSGVTLTPFKFIMKLKEEQKLNESYLSLDLTLSLLISDQEDLNSASGYCSLSSYSLNQKDNLWSELGNNLEFSIDSMEITANSSNVS
jgi:hypothetical protein